MFEYYHVLFLFFNGYGKARERSRPLQDDERFDVNFTIRTVSRQFYPIAAFNVPTKFLSSVSVR